VTATLPPHAPLIIQGLAAGDSRIRIADRLEVDESLVISEIKSACRALRIPRRHTALVHTALRRGVIELPPSAPVNLEKYLVDTLAYIAEGYSNPEIAAELWLSTEAVKSRVKRILRALDAKDRPHAVAIGWQQRLLHTSGLVVCA
jgi:DNA-binding NarL/FixJ family response regulator